jgi:hypothetical protein
MYERQTKSNAYLKSALLGATTYSAIDPIVVSLTVAYRSNFNRTDGLSSYKPGNMLLVNPAIAFAVNDRFTLNGGLQWSNTYPDKRDKYSI